MRRKPVITDIGVNQNKKFGYDLKDGKIYVRENQNSVSNYWGIYSSAPFLGTILYSLFHFYSSSSLELLVLSSVSIFLLGIIFILLIIFWIEHFLNWKNFGEGINIADLTKDELETLKGIKSGKGIIISFSIILGISLMVSFPIGYYFIRLSEISIWLIYVIFCLFSMVQVFVIFYMARSIKCRKIVLKEIESQEK